MVTPRRRKQMLQGRYIKSLITTFYSFGPIFFKIVALIVLVVVSFGWIFEFANDPIVVGVSEDTADDQTRNSSCAILLFGLPRQFKAAVLPGLVEHVLPHNRNCDVFCHYYDQNSESDYRGADRGRHGEWDPHEMLLLGDQIATHRKFECVHESETEFYGRYHDMLQKVWEPGSIYQTVSEVNAYSNTSLTNILKMWHSQQAVFELMEQSGVHYSIVGLLRNDVLFVQPFPDLSRSSVVVATAPGFGKFPVSDRFFYGPYDAVKIWAAGKFSRLHQHVQLKDRHGRRHGLHSEKVLQHTLFPAIRNAGVEIVEQDIDHACCLRVRADVSVRLQDCGRACATDPHNTAYVSSLLQRPCHLNTSNPDVAILECRSGTESERDLVGDASSWKACPWVP